MTGATIYKTTDATLLVKGIGGTVDLQTVRPLNASETFTINGVYEISGSDSDNPECDNKGHRISLQGTNLTDEDEETVDGNDIVTTRRQFGPSYLLNFNYSFY